MKTSTAKSLARTKKPSGVVMERSRQFALCRWGLFLAPTDSITTFFDCLQNFGDGFGARFGAEISFAVDTDADRAGV